MATAMEFSNQIDESELSKLHEEGVKLLDQLEQCWQNKNDLETRFRRLEALMQNVQQNPTASAQTAQYNQQLRDIYERLTQINRVIPALEQKLAKSIETCIGTCERLSSLADVNLQKWRWQQKESQYGQLTSHDALPEITRKYQTAMEHAFGCWRLLCRFHSSQTQQPANAQLANILQSLCHRIMASFSRILSASFVVTSQPPMVVKNKIRLEITLLAAIDKLGLETQSIQMSSRIISEETAAELRAKPELMSQKIPTVGQMENVSTKTKQIQRLSTNTLGFELKNIKITVESRKQATKSGEAIMKKYYFLCTTDVTFDNRTFSLNVFSLPFMVSVHGTQDVELYARAWWDMAFSKSLDDVPMIGEQEIRWHTMGPAIEAMFSMITKGTRRLTQHDIEYLKYRLFNGLPPESDPLVSWQQFYKDKLDRIGNAKEARRKCTFSFWEWLFRIGDMLQEKSGRDTGVFEMWEERYIEGFVSKQEAESRLLQASDPMMLIRFSDNQLAGLSIVCRSPFTNEIDHLIPFKFKEEIEKLTLPVMIVNCEQVKGIQIIYPDKSRDRIEHKAVSNKRISEETELSSDYKTRVHVLQSGEGARTPGYPPSPSPSNFVMNSKNFVTAPTSTMQLFPTQQYPNPIKLENTSTSVSNGVNFELPDELIRHMQNQDSQFDDLDDQTMQIILRNITRSNDDEDMDAFVRIVQSFPTNAFGQDDAAGTSNNNFDFDMI